MGVYLGYVQTVMNRLTIESLADAALNCMQMGNHKLLKDSWDDIPRSFNEKSIDSVVRIIVRIGGFHFIHSAYPKFSLIASSVNGVLGAVHLVVAFIDRFKITRSLKEGPEEWYKVALNIHKGFALLLIAGYDFGIGYLLTKKYTYYVIIVAFAMTPALALQWHQKIFRKPEEKSAENPPTESNNNSKSESTLSQTISANGAPATEETPTENFPTESNNDSKSESTSSQTISANAAPAPEEKQKEIRPSHLAKDCIIYTFAKYVTLELLPSKDGANCRMIERLSASSSENSSEQYDL